MDIIWQSEEKKFLGLPWWAIDQHCKTKPSCKKSFDVFGEIRKALFTINFPNLVKLSILSIVKSNWFEWVTPLSKKGLLSAVAHYLRITISSDPYNIICLIPRSHLLRSKNYWRVHRLQTNILLLKWNSTVFWNKAKMCRKSAGSLERLSKNSFFNK